MEMITLEVSITGAGQDELRQLETLMRKVLAELKPQLKGIEATVAAVPVVDRYESTKKKIIDHIRWRKITSRMPRDFWEVDIQDWLNPKDRDNLDSALQSLCKDGLLEEGEEPWEYYLTTEGYNSIY